MLKGNSRGIQAPQAPNCDCFTKPLRGGSCLHKARPRLLNINCRHSFQTCPTTSIPWFYVAMIKNVLAGWFFPFDYFLKWRNFWSNLVSIFIRSFTWTFARRQLSLFVALAAGLWCFTAGCQVISLPLPRTPPPLKQKCTP